MNGKAGIELPPEKDVRPLSGPFGLEEDLAILKELEKVQKDNNKTSPATNVGLGGILIFLIIFLIIMSYYIAPIYKDLTPVMAKAVLIAVWSMLLVLIFPLEMSGERPDLLGPSIRKYSKKWSFGPELVGAIMSDWDRAPYRYWRSEEAFVLAPMERESFIIDHFRKNRSSFLNGYLAMFPLVIAWMTFWFTGQPVPTLRAFLVALATAWAMFHIVLNFKYNYATRIHPRQWYLLRNGVMLGIFVIAVGVMVLMLWTMVVVGNNDEAFRALEGNYFLMAVFAIPGALTDLAVADSIPYLSFMIPILLWAAGYISYRRLQRADSLGARVQLAVMGRYKWGMERAAGKPKEAVMPETARKPPKDADNIRSGSIEWSAIDEGPGPKVILSKARLYEKNSRQKYIIMSVVITLVAIYGAVSAVQTLPVAGEDIIILIMPVAAFLLISLGTVRPGKEDGERTDILRMLPIDGKSVLDAMTEPMLKYSLLPYIVLTVALFAAFRVFDPAVWIFFLAVVPALFVAFCPFIVHFCVLDSMAGFFLTLAYIAAFALMCVYFNLMTMFIPLPLWVFMAFAAAAILPFGLLSRRVFIGGFHKRQLARKDWKRRGNVTITVVGMLLLIAAVIPIGLAAGGVIQVGERPERIAMTVSGQELVENSTVEYDGSVIVPAGKGLVIRNSFINFKVAVLGETRLYIEEGGSLIIYNSTVTADSFFRFSIFGEAHISDSVIRRMWGNDDYGGLRVGSDNVTIRRTTVEDGLTYGIDATGDHLTVSDCLIQNNSGPGISLYYADAELTNNIIRGNMLGVYVASSTCQLVNNTIQNNTHHGLMTIRSSPYVDLNRFYDNRRYAIVVYGDQEPNLMNNVFVNNTLGIIDHRPISSSFPLILLSTMPSIFVVMFPLMYLGHRREKMFSKVKAGREE